jgi:lipopolysaccharide/colanic/teichoic acid biosynthesis glycosyltransferase
MEKLRPTLPEIDQRLAGPPGLTGLAQIRSGYSNDLAGARRKLVYDLFYLKRRSLLAELRLLVLTIPKFWDRTAH